MYRIMGANDAPGYDFSSCSVNSRNVRVVRVAPLQAVAQAGESMFGFSIYR